MPLGQTRVLKSRERGRGWRSSEASAATFQKHQGDYWDSVSGNKIFFEKVPSRKVQSTTGETASRLLFSLVSRRALGNNPFVHPFCFVTALVKRSSDQDANKYYRFLD
jgi:hypothetical protein